MSDTDRHDSDDGLALKEARPELKEPQLYKVVLMNDDYTPMEFVVKLLEHLFGVCGVYTYEIAETKVAQVNEYSQRHQHPLLCTLEEV